jgi:uncharacterized protein (DUF58 family)
LRIASLARGEGPITTRPKSHAGLRALRIASLLVPSAIAWEIASTALHRTRLDDAVAHALGPLWMTSVGALVVRSVEVYARTGRGGAKHQPAERSSNESSGVSWVDALEVLTASGSGLAWSGAAAVVAATWLGWASLSVVGLFGLCALHLVALWTLLRASGHDPWRRDSLTRRFVPGNATEGEPLTEEVRWVAPRIPAGFRLLACGRIGPRWPLTRYAVQADDSAGEVLLESDLGPALRGVHDAEPLCVWLQDVLGLCRSPRISAGSARVTVTPKEAAIAIGGAQPLLARRTADEQARQEQRLPTEGSFRLREYQAGDDARRIHWLRSLAAQKVVVRLPDEVPEDRPAVQLVLDTFHPPLVSHGTLTCQSPDQLLDALVRIWLGVGRALSQRGMRVTAVAVVADAADPSLAASAPCYSARSAALRGGPVPGGGVLELGARASWQAAIAPASLLTGGPSLVVSHRLPVDDEESSARWVVVPSALWAASPDPPMSPAFFLPHPIGSADNRASRRRLVQARYRRARADHDVFRMLCEHPRARAAGHLLARPARADGRSPNGSGRTADVLLEVL